MKLFTNILYNVLILMCIISVNASCSKADDAYEGDDVGENFLTIKLSMSTSVEVGSRAYSTPVGGEDGDGREEGQCHENDIENITLFKFRGNIDSAPDTPVQKIGYKNNIGYNTSNATRMVKNGITYLVYEINVAVASNYEFTNSDYFVVAVNCGDFEASTLGELRDHLVHDAWKGERAKPKATYTEFAMSNEGARQLHGGSGTKEDPYIVEVDVERIAARIDFAVNGSTVAGNELKYPVTDGPSNTKVADLYLSHVRAFNVMIKPSYFIKRLSATPSGQKFYLRDELSGAYYSGVPMYVEEPSTWSKAQSLTHDVLADWYGNSGFFLSTREATWLSDLYRVHVGSGTAFTDGTSHDDLHGQDYYVLEYANENTMTPEGTTSQTATGLLLKGTYQPVKVYGGVDDSGQPTVDATYQKGQTYWRYRIMAQTHDESQVLYFSTQAAVNAYKAAHPEHIAEIKQYKNATSYYVVYLRHDATKQDPVPQNISPMEFAIVRNSIYRLQVSFSGPGFNTIPTETEIKPEGISPYIYVMKWNYILHPEIEI